MDKPIVEYIEREVKDEMADKPEINRNISIEVHGDINIINRSPKAWLYRKSRKENKQRLINVSDKPAVIDRKSIEWVEKYGHSLWMP